MKTNSPIERLYNGVVKENPTFHDDRYVPDAGRDYGGD